MRDNLGGGVHFVNSHRRMLCRHFDTARMYNNEDHLGEAIRESGIPREELFISMFYSEAAGLRSYGTLTHPYTHSDEGG